MQEPPFFVDMPETPPSIGPITGARVLVFDDEPQVLSTLVDLLESTGYATSASTNAAEVLASYQPGAYDVVLSNIGMAGMNGWEFGERLRAVDTQVPMLFITGWGLRDEDRARLGALRIQRCLFKPVRPEELDAAIQAALPASR